MNTAVPHAYNLLAGKELDLLRMATPERFEELAGGGARVDLRGVRLAPLAGVDEPKLAELSRIVRGFIFAAVDGAKSGHPGGSSSKTEMLLALLASGALRFDARRPKHTGRDRVVWSAGHCSPLLHSLGALIYEALRRRGFTLPEAERQAAVFPEELSRFRRFGGPAGHVESFSALADSSTGSSGHGISAGLGFAALHSSCGLPTRCYVIAGDAETEEGMTYEARNIASTLALRNLVVLLDHNGFGIDGPITDAMPYPYINHWFAMGWNVIEANGHDIREMAYACRLAAGDFGEAKPTVIVCHCTKGLHYGRLENTSDSHGTPLGHDEYVQVMRDLRFEIPGQDGDAAADLRAVAAELRDAEIDYLIESLNAAAALLRPEEELKTRMSAALAGRPIADFRSLERPATLPPELVFQEGSSVPTRKASEAWFHWAMKNTAFFYVGCGDLMKSILTGKAEGVYGVLSRNNPLGRGLRFGIAEQNMAMMSCAIAQDTLPGGFRPMSAFGSYAVFTPMMANSVRMALINNDVNPRAKAFFIVLAAHDGPETGEDGPTHHGLFWMSLFTAYPGIKVYKPLDANEAIEMFFHAARLGEPVAFSVARPGTPVLKRGGGVPPAIEAINGAYVFKPYREDGKRKRVIAVSGGQVMANLLDIVPELEEAADVKIVAVTSPQLFEDLRRTDPRKAESIFSEDERQTVITLHNGWPGFLYSFALPADYDARVFGMDHFSRSGKPPEIYRNAGFDAAGLRERILPILNVNAK